MQWSESRKAAYESRQKHIISTKQGAKLREKTAERLNADIEAYLAKGGEVHQLPSCTFSDTPQQVYNSDNFGKGYEISGLRVAK